MSDRSKQSQVIGGKSIFILVWEDNEDKGNGGKSEVAILFKAVNGYWREIFFWKFRKKSLKCICPREQNNKRKREKIQKKFPLSDRRKEGKVIRGKSIFFCTIYKDKVNGGKSEEVVISFQWMAIGGKYSHQFFVENTMKSKIIFMI